MWSDGWYDQESNVIKFVIFNIQNLNNVYMEVYLSEKVPYLFPWLKMKWVYLFLISFISTPLTEKSEHLFLIP